MRCIKPIRIFKNLPLAEYPEGLLVPCGKCISCRIHKRQEWKLRMIHELTYHEKASFVTLTYNDQNLPGNETLIKKDLQKFFKRLRKNLGGRKIKYFACGEYGDKYQRPHYHAIIFGCGLDKDDKMIVESSWQYGFIHFGIAEPDSIGYVAQYIDKKLTGDLAEQEYIQKGREPVFRILSQGIGRDHAMEMHDRIREQKKLTLNGVPVSIPRYYLKKLDVDTTSFKDHSYYKDSEEVEKLIGLNIHPDVLYKIDTKTWRSYRNLLENKRVQREKNIKAKINLKKRDYEE